MRTQGEVRETNRDMDVREEAGSSATGNTAGGGAAGRVRGQRRSEDDTGPITFDGVMPQKRFYRARAHVNPLSHNSSFD